MSTAQEAMYNEALSALEAGDRARARDLFTRLLKTGQDHPEYWVWMSAVVETQKERIFCLKEALRLDPQNVEARRGLTVLGALPPEPGQVLPPRYQRLNWQARLAAEQTEAHKPVAPVQIVLIGVAAVAVIGLILYALFGSRGGLKEVQFSFMDLSTPTAVAGTATTPTPVRTVTAGSPTPLWMQLKATYTATPLYVNTPHPVSEAYRIGMRAYQRGDWGNAVNYFNQVLKEDEGAVDVAYYLGEAYRQQGDLTNALAVFNKTIQQASNFAPLYLGRARARFASNPRATKEVLADLQLAIDKDPNYGEAYLEMAKIQISSRQTEDALATLDEASLYLPDSPMVFLYRAEANLALGNDDAALADARRANELDVTLLLAYRMIGEVLFVQNDLKGALDVLQTYATYEPDDAEAWVWIAKAHHASKDSEQALKSLDIALRLDNRSFTAYLLRGQILLAQGKADKAVADFQKAVQFDAESYEAVMGYGQALMAVGTRGAIGDAYAQFEAAKPLAETDRQKAEQLYWRALCLEKLNEVQAALRDLQTLLTLPAASVDPAWTAYAKKRVAELITATYTPVPKTATPTATATSTRWPTATRSPTPTKKPTLTLTPVPTKKP